MKWKSDYECLVDRPKDLVKVKVSHYTPWRRMGGEEA
jgi:hypothetical protein